MQTQNPYEPPKANAYHPTNGNSTRAELQKIAKGQQLVIYAILAYFLLVAINGAILSAMGALGSILLILALLAILGASLWGVILLSTNMNYHIVMTILVVIFMFIPLINWITLLILNSKATGILRKGGYKVGFFGAKPHST